jgi:hypothetical protein
MKPFKLTGLILIDLIILAFEYLIEQVLRKIKSK